MNLFPTTLRKGRPLFLVVRNEELKVRIVMHEEYAISLIGEDLQDAGVALHLIVAGVSLANAINNFERDLPGFLIEPVMSDNHDAVLHCAMRKAIRAYRYAYDSAGCGSDNIVEQEFSKYVVHALDASYGEIYDLKQVHADDKDHPKFF
ncbi:hypothetical protein [Xanthomonas arboricola]|uniref:hypothetical protein n=1 Tax=Xanthomonas arboricola TaxID=56448 RepID=UPI00128EE680|nr:hypothetical protein [Xanthomonas arboricola]